MPINLDSQFTEVKEKLSTYSVKMTYMEFAEFCSEYKFNIANDNPSLEEDGFLVISHSGSKNERIEWIPLSSYQEMYEPLLKIKG